MVRGKGHGEQGYLGILIATGPVIIIVQHRAANGDEIGPKFPSVRQAVNIETADDRARATGIAAVSPGNRRVGVRIELDDGIEQTRGDHQLLALDPGHARWIVKRGRRIAGHGIGTRTGNPHAGGAEFIEIKAAGSADTRYG